MTNLKFGSCTALSSSYLWLKHRGLSLSRLRVGFRLSLHIDMDSVPTILTTFYHMHHCNYAATGDMVKCFICTTIYDRVYHWTAEQFQVDRALLSPPIRNHPSSNHTTAAPSQRYVERGYVCVYINYGHYSRLGDIKMFEWLYNYVWCTFHMCLEINFMWLPVECHAYLCNCTQL